MTIRPFEQGDLSAAYALWARTPGVGLSDADTPEGITRFLQRNPRLSFVAVDGDSMAGTILCGHDGRRGMIHHLVVDAVHRRRGLARMLLDRSRAALRQEGIVKAHLMVFRTNEAGLAFWQRAGIERTELALFSVMC